MIRLYEAATITSIFYFLIAPNFGTRGPRVQLCFKIVATVAQLRFVVIVKQEQLLVNSGCESQILRQMRSNFILYQKDLAYQNATQRCVFKHTCLPTLLSLKQTTFLAHLNN